MTDQEIINKMERLVGSFVQALAKAARAADPVNLQRIKNTWPEYWHRHTGLPLPVLDTETRLKGAIIEACEWLRMGSSGRALEVLEQSLKPRE